MQFSGQARNRLSFVKNSKELAGWQRRFRCGGTISRHSIAAPPIRFHVIMGFSAFADDILSRKGGVGNAGDGAG